MPETWLWAAVGGSLIGLSASLVLLVQGRVAGISGLLRRGLLARGQDRGRWRLTFVLGLLLAGFVSTWMVPSMMAASSPRPWRLIAAGLLVGFGTQLGSGCTSGHGVCGLGRGSPRSILAVLVFMSTAAWTVYMERLLFAEGG